MVRPAWWLVVFAAACRIDFTPLDRDGPIGDGPTHDGGIDGDWFDPAWQRRIPITLQNPIDGILDHMPILVRLSPKQLDHGRLSSGGRDIRIIDGAGSELPYDIDTLSATGETLIWIDGGVLMPSGSTTVYLYYDNPAAPMPATGGAWSSNYSAVFHLTTPDDSSPNGNLGSNMGAVPIATPAGNGFQFTASAGTYISITDNAFPLGASPRTICASAKTDSLGGGLHWIASYGGVAPNDGFFIGRIGSALRCGGIQNDIVLTGFWAIGAWHYVCCSYDGTTAVLYADGQRTASQAKPWSVTPLGASIGRQTTNDEWWDGTVDELRISDVVRTDAWLLAEYRTLTGTWFEVGAEETHR